MHRTLATIRKLYEGQSLARIQMNYALSGKIIRGKVVDIGGAREPDYFLYLKKEGVISVEAVDGKINGIDFEQDALPFPDASVDTVICANLLEHIYHYGFLLGQINRILKPNAHLVGFVPFWVGYHPDPHDYFRYTEEALRHMLMDAGFINVDIQPLSVGPILANFNTIVLSLPRIMRPGVYVWYAICNTIFTRMRPTSISRNPLGFVFTAQHHA